MIGVTISNKDRHKLFYDTLSMWRQLMPKEGVLVVVDDASNPPLVVPDDVTLVRNKYRLGVSMTKNKGIAALMDAGCDHLFLADSDVFPVVKDWWQPYVDSPEPHLSAQWAKIPSRPGLQNRWRIEHDDGTHFSISFPRGVLLYAERKVIDTVGGMDPCYGVYSGEHVEWAQRIHDAGLTTWRFADVCGSDKIWYSHDKEQGNTVGSCFSLPERRKLAKSNGLLWEKKRPDGPYVPYREGDGVQDYGLGPSLGDEPLDALKHVLSQHPAGVAVEAGVGSGGSTRLIANKMPVIGFDSFLGLPADWRVGFPAGSFACDPPQIENVIIVTGLFEDTMPDFDFAALGYIGILHLDADLYSSTATALKHIGPHLQPGSYICFDEYHSWPGWENDGECRAWKQYTAESSIGWTVIGRGPEQLVLRVI